MKLDITVTKNAHPKEKPADEAKLGFGKIFTDHMFLMDYTDENGWHNARIVPYGPLSLDPSAMVFHYAQELFEGLKAYRRADGGIQLFRPDCNIERMGCLLYTSPTTKTFWTIHRSWTYTADFTTMRSVPLPGPWPTSDILFFSASETK